MGKVDPKNFLPEARLFLVTPLKDERTNIDRLIKAIENQTLGIFAWVIVENDSTDGSKEYLETINKVKNVHELRILHLSTSDPSYNIGFKISKIYQHGLNYFEENYSLKEGDYIGILDADSFPEKHYFKTLVEKLESEDKLGLVSGILVNEDGRRDKVSNYTVRGSGRVWKYNCYKEAAFYYGLGADRTTQFRAEILGWKTEVIDDVHFVSRNLDARADYKYRGESDYYNGCTFLYVILKSIFLLFRNPQKTGRYLTGYLEFYFKNHEKNSDIKILDYNKKNLRRVFKRLLNRKFNP